MATCLIKTEVVLKYEITSEIGDIQGSLIKTEVVLKCDFRLKIRTFWNPFNKNRSCIEIDPNNLCNFRLHRV